MSIQEYEKVVIFRLGWILRGGERGIFFILPSMDKYEIVDQNWSVPPEGMITIMVDTVKVRLLFVYNHPEQCA